MSKGKKPRNPVTRPGGRPMPPGPKGLPGGGMGGGGMGNLMSQMQKLQADMAAAQAALESEEVTVSAGGGAITVVATGDQKIKAITIKQEVVDPADVEMLQDLVLAAVNEALDKAHALQEERMGGLTGGLNLPAGLGL